MQNTNEYVTDLGHLHLRIEEILDERGISKNNKLCKDMDIPRTNFNRYCQDKQTRWDLKFLCKLCLYLNVDLGELTEYIPPTPASKWIWISGKRVKRNMSGTWILFFFCIEGLCSVGWRIGGRRTQMGRTSTRKMFLLMLLRILWKHADEEHIPRPDP